MNQVSVLLCLYLCWVVECGGICVVKEIGIGIRIGGIFC